MSTTETETQHRCSCGRTFRHGISLKRHQKVSGCVEAEASSVEVKAALAPIAAVAPKKEAAPLLSWESEDSPATVVVTAQQIAIWQKEKLLPEAVAPTAQEGSLRVDWTALKATGLDFVDFTVEQFSSLGRVVGSMAGLGARFTLFGGFLVALGWVLLFGLSQDLSAAPSNSVGQREAARLSAESTVSSFLQTSRMGQFDRARAYLSEKTQRTVSADDLQQMFSKLPITETPAGISAGLEQSDQVAKVTVQRSGQAEVYTLVREAHGWGLASVSVQRS